jgi:hypothetical protein
MQREKRWQLTAALLLGLGVPAVASADPPPRPGSTSIFNQWLHPGSTPPPPKSTDQKDAPKPAPKPANDPIAKIRAEELANCLRRTEVCLKLMQVADETNDEALRKKAEELDRRVRSAFKKRMAELTGTSEDDLLVKPQTPKRNEARTASSERNDEYSGLDVLKDSHSSRSEAESEREEGNE